MINQGAEHASEFHSIREKLIHNASSRMDAKNGLRLRR
jgi:hypothetical protein